MPKANRPITLGLCAALSLTAVGCWGRHKAAPPNEDQQPQVTEPETPAQTPASTPTATPTPQPPEPGVGGTGQAVNPPQAAQLIAAEPGSKINLRSQPTTSSSAKGYGLVGDPVMLLRSAEASDGTWYYVKFEQSGAEGWIRGDFINTEGRATPLSPQASQSNTCDGVMEGMAVTAFYDGSGFHMVRFVNLETKNTFDATLSRQGSNNAGKPLYQGTASPPTGGSYPVALTDLSGGNPGSGSQVALDYAGIEGSVACK
ncbi:SH3 domain-containing protein [Nodosilinea nodulosa]|uniref:SH3 domain-containing protein n=1 Tax=Nodosilinea nodulosa TaxID=416001 RepID=UPI0002D41E11|nr:SH3 domain-containing protein [Nodosilinea nodulosa]